MSIALRTMTAEELLRMSEDGYRYELIEGELRHEKDRLTGDPVAPGFMCAVTDLFSGIK